MDIITVAIRDQNGEITTGEVIKGVAAVGEVVTVKLRDQNGMPIEATGTVEEVLEVSTPWGERITHGGSRPGAGRPKSDEPARPRSIRLTDTEWQQLQGLGGADWIRLQLNQISRP